MKWKSLSLIMFFCLLFTTTITPATASAIASPVLDLANGTILSDT